jgi:UDP-N-acetylmuramate dehydrogenase
MTVKYNLFPLFFQSEAKRQQFRIMKVVNITVKVFSRIVYNSGKSKLPDPAVYGNAGSFFMNPVVPFGKFDALLADYPNMPYYKLDDGVKIPAGWMIEQCGWKGRALGRAGVHDRQALVLVNLGGATGDDVLALCDAVRKSVMDKFGVEIHPEVNVI